MNDLLNDVRAYTPEVIGERHDAPVVVCGGMGGSALPALLARFLKVKPYVVVHRSYELPHAISPAHYVALSYSGNTEETLSFVQMALSAGLPLSIVTAGGELLSLARDGGIPHVVVPAGLQPRDAVVATTKALLALLGEDALVQELSENDVHTGKAEVEGVALAQVLENAIPVFYSSTDNEALSYIAKIQCNETAKIPAFSNVFPELNHNEMQGWGGGEGATALHKDFVAVFMESNADLPPIRKRMELTKKLLTEKGVRTHSVVLPAVNKVHTFIYTWWMMRTLARTLAAHYGVDPDATPLIESFKKEL